MGPHLMSLNFEVTSTFKKAQAWFYHRFGHKLNKYANIFFKHKKSIFLSNNYLLVEISFDRNKCNLHPIF